MQTPPPTTLQKIMRRGASRVNKKPSTERLLMQMSEQDHKRIAQLIQKWLNTDEKGKRDNKPPR